MNYEQNAANFATKHGIKLIINSQEYRPYFPDDKESRHVFKCTLIRNKKRYTFTFGQSITKGGESPSIYSILACLQKYEIGTFENFCSEFGYNEDDTTSKRTYKAVCKEYNAVFRLFGDILDELQEIQ
jgi:hypothetical protein